MDDWSISRERAFELFSEAEQTGWIRTRQRPGKPSERLPVIPTRQMPPDGSAADTRQAAPDGSVGSESADHVHPSGGTRRVKRGGAGRTRQARPDYTRQAAPDATGTGQEQPGGTLPPDPLRTERTQAPTRTDHEQELTLVPDHNDTRKVTSRTRAPAESCDRPLLAVIEDPEREIIWTEMQPTIHRVTQPPTTGAAS